MDKILSPTSSNSLIKDINIKEPFKLIKPILSDNNKKKFSMIILFFIVFVLLLYFIGLYKLLTSKKYKTIYDSKSTNYLVLLNLFLSYVQIIFIILLLFNYRIKILNNIKKSNIFKYGFVILAFIYSIYIISILQFTYILNNIDYYNENDFYFLTNYYTFMQFIPFILFFVYIYKYKNFIIE